MVVQVIKTDGLICPEMREERGWREHLDYHGLAATAYLLLFTDYMDIVRAGDRWEAKGSFKRWWQQELWKEFFHEFLNIKVSGNEIFNNQLNLHISRFKLSLLFETFPEKYKKKLVTHF